MTRSGIRRILVICLTLCLVLAGGTALSGHAAETVIPTLFHNDEAWYKDSIAPLVVRNGKYFIPADLCAMFETVSVTTPRADNLLITNTETGSYISILFHDQSAAVNGKILDSVGVFRDAGMYYVEAAPVCEAIGLTMEAVSHKGGTLSLRVTDGGEDFPMDFLVQMYQPEENAIPEDVEETPEDQRFVRRIYILCTTPDRTEPAFPARKYLDQYGLEYTLFFQEDTAVETALTAYAAGEYGIVSRNMDEENPAEACDALNRKFRSMTMLHSHLTLSTGKEAVDSALREAGYLPISPDFTVNGNSDVEQILEDMLTYLITHKSCTIKLEDCWNSAQMIRLISELSSASYKTANLSEKT